MQGQDQSNSVLYTDLHIRVLFLNSLLEIWQILPGEIEQVQVLRTLMRISQGRRTTIRSSTKIHTNGILIQLTQCLSDSQLQ
jgi:hypothetical protein